MCIFFCFYDIILIFHCYKDNAIGIMPKKPRIHNRNVNMAYIKLHLADWIKQPLPIKVFGDETVTLRESKALHNEMKHLSLFSYTLSVVTFINDLVVAILRIHSSLLLCSYVS